jgi:hypothetical protein
MIPLMISACPLALTPELVIAIATAALAIATVVLAGVTTWLASATRNMAKAATKALEFEQMPILGFRDLKVDVGRWQPGQLAMIQSISIGIELFNSGRVPVKYKVKSFSNMFTNQGFKSGEFLSGGGRVLPGASTVFWHPTLSLTPPVSTFPANGRIRFEYDYSDESDRQARSIVDTVDYTVSRGEGGQYMTNWLNVNEPSAS